MTDASPKRILVDTSIWIEYFRKRSPFFSEVEQLIDDNRVCICRFISAELLQGAKTESEFNTLKESTEIFHLLDESPDTWTQAARLSYDLKREGKTVGLGDCYIAALAHQYKVSLWTLDKHFSMIQTKCRITLHAQ